MVAKVKKMSTIRNLNFLKFNVENKFFQNLFLVYGIGKFYRKELLFRLGYSKFKVLNVQKVDNFFISRLYKFSKNVIKTYNTRFRKLQAVLRLQIKIKTKKSIYLRQGYPVHNQRRRTNGKTASRLNRILFLMLTTKK